MSGVSSYAFLGGLVPYSKLVRRFLEKHFKLLVKARSIYSLANYKIQDRDKQEPNLNELGKSKVRACLVELQTLILSSSYLILRRSDSS